MKTWTNDLCEPSLNYLNEIYRHCRVGKVTLKVGACIQMIYPEGYFDPVIP